jgi:predicted transcriptional regulator
MQALAETLRLARKAGGLSLDELSHRVGANRMTLHRLETGQTDPRLSTVSDLLRALGLELVVVPAAVRQDVEQFIQSHGRVIGQPTGVDAPASVADVIAARVAKR